MQSQLIQSLVSDGTTLSSNYTALLQVINLNTLQWLESGLEQNDQTFVLAVKLPVPCASHTDTWLCLIYFTSILCTSWLRLVDHFKNKIILIEQSANVNVL